MSRLPMEQSIQHSEVYPAVTDELLVLMVERIRAAGKPLEIVLFGSRARGDSRPNSDIDLFILEESEGELAEKRFAYETSLKGLYPEMTVLVESFKQVQEWRHVPRYIATEALREGRVLFKDDERLAALQGKVDEAGLVSEEEIEYKTPEDLARLWFERADRDMHACQVLIADETYDSACFHAQQAAEKYLKGFLAYHDNPVAKTHCLDTLVANCRKVMPLPELDLLRLKEISKYAISGRYDLTFYPSKKQAEEAYEHACSIRKVVLSRVPPAAQPKSKFHA